MVQHPHVIKYQLKTPTAGPTRNADGDLLPGTSTTVSIDEPCRVQPSVRSSYIISEIDGQRIEFNSIIYLGRYCTGLPIGQMVEVFEGDNLILKGSIKRFHRGQIQARAWI